MPRQPVTTVPLRKSTRIRDAAIAKAAPPPIAAQRRAARVQVAPPPPNTVPPFPPMVAYNLRRQTGGNFAKSDFKMGRILGEGGQGSVHLATIKNNNYKVAIKRMSNVVIGENGEEINRRDKIKREIDCHKQMIHPNILRVYGYFWTKEDTYIVMEVVDRVNVYDMDRKFTQKEAAHYIYQLTNALIYSHSKNVYHRDLKLQNLIIDSNGELKLCDYGWSVNESNRRRTYEAGTITHRAPEMFGNRGFFGEKADVWALGIILFELLVNDLPPFYDDDDVTIKRLITTAPLEFPGRHVTKLGRDLISGLLEKNPKDRMKLEDVLTHDWIVKHNS